MNKIYRRSLFQNLRFSEGYIHEDVQITPILLDKAERIGALNHLLYNYNIHLGSSSTSGMKMDMLKIKSLVAMNRSVYDYFINRNYKNISGHTAGLYFNALLNGFYISAGQKGIEWQQLKKELKQEIARLKPTIKAVYPSVPYKVYFVSPLIFRILKTGIIKFKQLKYNIKS